MSDKGNAKVGTWASNGPEGAYGLLHRRFCPLCDGIDDAPLLCIFVAIEMKFYGQQTRCVYNTGNVPEISPYKRNKYSCVPLEVILVLHPVRGHRDIRLFSRLHHPRRSQAAAEGPRRQWTQSDRQPRRYPHLRRPASSP